MASGNRYWTQAAARPAGWLARARTAARLEPWFTPFALVNGAGVGLSPILLPVVAARYGVGHVGLVMGAFNLGAIGHHSPAASPTGSGPIVCWPSCSRR